MYNNKSFSKNNCPGGDKLSLCYSSNNVNTPCKETPRHNESHHDKTNDVSPSELEIPMKYKGLFKRIYSASVCIDRNNQWYNEGLFYVKRMGIKKLNV